MLMDATDDRGCFSADGHNWRSHPMMKPRAARYPSNLQSQQVFRIVSHDWRSRVTAVFVRAQLFEPCERD
jgi:hypothetical protein